MKGASTGIVLASLLGAIVGGTVSSLATVQIIRRTAEGDSVLHVKTLEVVDDLGQTRARLTTSPNRLPSLTFLSAEGKPMLAVGIEADTFRQSTPRAAPMPFIDLNDQKGLPAIGLTAQDRNGVVRFYGQDNASHILLGYLDASGDLEVQSLDHAWGLHIKDHLHENGIGVIEEKDLRGRTPYILPQK